MSVYRSMVFIVLLIAPFRQTLAADNLLIVTLDGLRWQEVFGGPDQQILASLESSQRQALEQQFGASADAASRQKLMPFVWQQVATRGVIIGNRPLGSTMQVSNDMWFSYPGYNELLTGQADPNITSNDLNDNANVTILEWLHRQPAYQHKVAVFGSWDAFGAIINQRRSQVVVNSGFQSADWQQLNQQARWLNELQAAVPQLWPTVRYDAFTVAMAQAYISSHQPKVIYLALGETDDYAHAGNYAEYLRGAHRDDQLIARLWQQLQSMPGYRNNTNLLITVDHGRGQTPQDWQHHSSSRAMALHGSPDKGAIVGSDQIWLAAMGPDIEAKGETLKGNYSLSQVAATALHLLGQSAPQYNPQMGAMLPLFAQSD